MLLLTLMALLLVAKAVPLGLLWDTVGVSTIETMVLGDVVIERHVTIVCVLSQETGTTAASLSEGNRKKELVTKEMRKEVQVMVAYLTRRYCTEGLGLMLKLRGFLRVDTGIRRRSLGGLGATFDELDTGGGVKQVPA